MDHVIALRSKVGRNDPCPCGSRKKFKRCCLDSSRDRFDGRRVVERNGQRILVSEGITDAELAAADDFFAAKAAGRGPAADIADYAAPLPDSTDGSPKQIEAALTMAMAFWNLVLVRDDAERQATLDDIVSRAFQGDEDETEFRNLAHDMVERHRSMFPEMHEERGA